MTRLYLAMLAFIWPVVALAQEAAGVEPGQASNVGLEYTIGAAVTWGAVWLAKKILPDAIEARWVPRIALTASIVGTTFWKLYSTGASWKVAGLAALQGAIQAFIATGAHENAVSLKKPNPES